MKNAFKIKISLSLINVNKHYLILLNTNIHSHIQYCMAFQSVLKVNKQMNAACEDLIYLSAYSTVWLYCMSQTISSLSAHEYKWFEHRFSLFFVT